MARAMPTRVLGRCPFDGCKTRVNLEAYPDPWTGLWGRKPWVAMQWFTAEYPNGSNLPIVVVERHHDFYRTLEGAQRDGLLPHCVEHRVQLRFMALRTIKTTSPCAWACVYAEGDSDKCSCSCGGSNHGTEVP